MSLNILVQGLNAAQKGIQAVSQNLVNYQTEGYHRKVVYQVSRYVEATVGSGVEVRDIIRNYDKFLERNVRDSTSLNEFYKSQLSYLTQLNGSVSSSASGVAAQITKFFNSIQSLASNPRGLPQREAVLQQLSLMTASFKQIDGVVDDLNRGINDQVISSVRQMNTLSESIARINSQVQRLWKGDRNQPNDLLDRRDQILDELSKYIETQVTENDDGTINVSVGSGQSLVIGTTNLQLETVISVKPGEGESLVVKYKGGSGSIPSRALSGGSLGGALSAREVINDTRQRIGEVVYKLIQDFNRQNRQGLDSYGNWGRDLFSTDFRFPPFSPPTKDYLESSDEDKLKVRYRYIIRAMSVNIKDPANLATASPFYFDREASYNYRTVPKNTNARNPTVNPPTQDDMILPDDFSTIADKVFDVALNGDSGRIDPKKKFPAGMRTERQKYIESQLAIDKTVSISAIEVRPPFHAKAQEVDPKYDVNSSINGGLTMPIQLKYDAKTSSFTVFGGDGTRLNKISLQSISGTSGGYKFIDSTGSNLGISIKVNGQPQDNDVLVIGRRPPGNGRLMSDADNSNLIVMSQLQTDQTIFEYPVAGISKASNGSGSISFELNAPLTPTTIPPTTLDVVRAEVADDFIKKLPFTLKFVDTAPTNVPAEFNPARAPYRNYSAYFQLPDGYEVARNPASLTYELWKTYQDGQAVAQPPVKVMSFSINRPIEDTNLLGAEFSFSRPVAYSYQEAVGKTLTVVGSATNFSSTLAKSTDSVLNQAKESQQSFSGVDINSEFARLLEYQKSFQSAAKSMQVVQSLFQSVLQALG